MNPQLDPQALNLAKAIRRAETGTSSDPYNAIGASGERGAYQFMPDTWKQWAGQYLQDSNAEMSIENQNKVAYSRIKELKDQGLNPAQIASKWNSGNENAYMEDYRGVNKHGVEYDVPAYTKKVSAYYKELSGGGMPSVMQNVQTVENRPLVETTVTPQVQKQVQSTKELQPEENKDLGSRIGRGVLEFVAPAFVDKERTGGQWVGDIGLTALNAVPGAALAKAGVKAFKAGAAAFKSPKVLSAIEKAAEKATQFAKGIFSKKNALIGLGTGYGMDVASSLSEGETDVGGIFKPGFGTFAGGITGGLIRKSPRSVVEKTARDLIPDVSYGKGVSQTGKTGLEKTGLLRTIQQPITTDVYRTTEAVLHNVPEFNKLGTYTDKLNAVNTARNTLADDLAKQVVQNGDDIIYPFRELQKKMKDLEPPIQVRADVTQMNQYKIAREAALKIAQAKGGKISNLFEARKEFDRLVDEQFPTLYDRQNAPMRQAITDMRKVMNETIEEALKGRGVNYSDSLMQQTMLFDARDALASKAYSEIGTNSLERYMNKHSLLKSAVEGTVKNTIPIGIVGGTGAWLLKD